MRKCIATLFAFVILLSCVIPAAAFGGWAVYAENAKKFIVMHGYNYAGGDLFPDLKSVMPGDSLKQRVLVINDTSNNCKIKVYLRALGAKEGSEEFLSQMNLTVAEETGTIMFDAPADERAQLKNWVYLGTLYSGGQCELTVTLDVPVTMGNEFANEIGYLDWQFAVEELPIEEGDPDPPRTGDDSNIKLWAGLMAGSAIIFGILLIVRRKRKQK